MPLSQFLNDVFWPAAWKARAAVVGFNLPFDLARLAWRVGEPRTSHPEQPNPYRGGFSFTLFRRPKEAKATESKWRARIAVKTIDSKRALKGFRSAEHVDPEDQIPDEPMPDVETRPFKFRGHFLDLRTLVFALTDRSHSLESACATFGAAYTKRDVTHGDITPEYVDYCREDVEATQHLCERAVAEFLSHPIELQATRAFSPASLGRSYLDAMGVRPLLERQGFDPRILGWAMSAYYGGRAEARIRRVPVPVVYVDFLSMYPSICGLLRIWELLTARNVQTDEDAGERVQQLLDRVTLDDCFDPTTWHQLVGIAQLAPDGDVVPVRARYTKTSWQIGLNPLTSDEALWYPIADLVASKLLTGTTPKILRAVRFEPTRARSAGLRPVALMGQASIDPRAQDFFRAIIEERKRIDHSDLPEAEREWRSKGLKILANATAYGIYAQMTRRELNQDERETVTVHGYREEPFTREVTAPEDPGPFCFPPFAACITGGARLMLAMLERLVDEAGGSYAFCDTDSMAIVATEHGTDQITCPGGPTRTETGEQAITALSWAQVDAIRARFEALKPYDRQLVPDALLELEDYNYEDPHTGTNTRRRQLYCYAISAKRYVLYNEGPGGLNLRSWSLPDDTGEDPDATESAIRKPSEHGLGHLLNPTDPENPDRNWIRQAWEYLLAIDTGLRVEEPAWLDRPAITRTTVSTPRLHRLFHQRGQSYDESIKPFNFMNVAYVSRLARPDDEPRFRARRPLRTRSDALAHDALVQPLQR